MTEKMSFNDCCATCKFLRRLKHNFSSGVGYELSFVCVAFEYCERDQTENPRNNFMVEVDPTDTCEMYSKAEYVHL